MSNIKSNSANLPKGTEVFYSLVTSDNIIVKEGTVGVFNPFEGKGYVEKAITKEEALKDALYRQSLLRMRDKREGKAA